MNAARATFSTALSLFNAFYGKSDTFIFLCCRVKWNGVGYLRSKERERERERERARERERERESERESERERGGYGLKVNDFYFCTRG